MNARRNTNKIAASQHSLITKEQALKAGLSLGRIRRRVRSGEWEVIRPNVYRLSGAPPSWTQAVGAVALALQPRAWLSHETAGRLWNLVPAEPNEIDVLVDLVRRVKLLGVHSHRSGAIFTADVTEYHRIPVTTPERTLVDLSGTVPPLLMAQMLDDALRRRLVRLERLRLCVARLRKSPGRRPAVLQELLAARLPGYDPGDSDLETRVLRLLVCAGLRAPVQQHRIRAGSRTFRIDLAYPDRKLTIELDGWEFHRSRSAFDDDRARANALVLAGWTVVRFTSRSTDGDVEHCVRTALYGSGRSGAA